MQFKSLTDKFYYILTSDELYNMELGAVANIVSLILDEISTETIKYFVFRNIDDCKQFIGEMNSRIGEDIVEFNEMCANSDVIKNNACMLTMTNDDDGGFTCKLDIHDDDAYTDYDFMIAILEDKISNNNINLRKLLKRVLHNRTVKRFIANYDIDNVVFDDLL